MLIRSGWYAVYQGKVFEAYEEVIGKGNIALISLNSEDIKNGFNKIENTDNRFKKYVDISELEKAYYVTTFAEYRGYKFSVSKSKEDGMCALFTGNSKEAEELGFEFIDRMSYWKRVKLQDLTKIWEELEPNWGFEGEKEIRMIKG